MEQEEEVLKETFREAAKEQLTKRIFKKIDEAQPATQPAAQPPVQPPVQPAMQNKDKWIKDLRNIAAEMIEGSEKPMLSKQQQKQWNDLQEVPQAQGEQQVEDD